MPPKSILSKPPQLDHESNNNQPNATAALLPAHPAPLKFPLGPQGSVDRRLTKPSGPHDLLDHLAVLSHGLDL